MPVGSAVHFDYITSVDGVSEGGLRDKVSMSVLKMPGGKCCTFVLHQQSVSEGGWRDNVNMSTKSREVKWCRVLFRAAGGEVHLYLVTALMEAPFRRRTVNLVYYI